MQQQNAELQAENAVTPSYAPAGQTNANAAVVPVVVPVPVPVPVAATDDSYYTGPGAPCAKHPQTPRRKSWPAFSARGCADALRLCVGVPSLCAGVAEETWKPR